MTKVQEVVAAGSAWLDQVQPGWETRIDPRTLDLRSSCWCVVGQVLGHYKQLRDFSEAAAVVPFIGQPRPVRYVNGEWARDHGFLSVAALGLLSEDLKAEWLNVIADRLVTTALTKAQKAVDSERELAVV